MANLLNFAIVLRNNMKKIFMIGNVASMMINFRQELIIKLSKENEVYCLTTDYDEKSKDKIRSFGAIPLDYSLNAKGLNPFKDILATINLIKTIKKYKPDIVFSFFVKPVIFGSMAAKFSGVKKIIGMIEGLGNAFTNHKDGLTIKAKIIKFVQICLYKISLPLLDTLILLNNDDKKDLIDDYNINVKKVEILGGIGVDLDKFAYLEAPTQPISFIFIARLLKEKGIFEYLQAAKIIKEKYSQTKFYIFGTFDEKNPFALKKEELEIYLKDEIVIYPGFVDNINEQIAKCSVFVLPSYREGFPRSTQEAMAIGRAVITTDVPGCRDTVQDGINGFLISPHNAEILAEKMEIFIKNPNLISQMGEKSRQIAEQKFDINKANERLGGVLVF